MATVYRAYDERHDRSVAIKVLHPDVAVSVGAERFQAEIHTTAKLAHPNILPLFDSSDDDVLYYVMPLVSGESLRTKLEREKTVDTDDALRITREVADALAYAHANGVIHRDIKPENILLQSGHALVADFGIARASSSSGNERITTAGLTVGTPAYMSPEQAAADPHVDGRSDQYSLACVLFEMLVGEAPFAGPSVDAILVRRFTRPPPRASSRRSGIPRHIDGALLTAMARSPDERFASMGRFVDALSSPAHAWGTAESEASVAVLPFTNMSADPENEYFGDGMAEEIISALSQVPGLRVAARTSTFSFKGKNTDLRDIGEKLNVSTVLEGSVRKAGNRVRITAQLINVDDGHHLWSERYDRELTDIFAIQDEIATAIASRLAVALRGGDSSYSLVRPSTSNLDAYEHYLKARALMKERGPALLRAIEYLEHAVKLDPNFAPALAHLAHSLILSSFWGMSPPDRIRERAEWAASSALEHDATLVAAHTASALVATCILFDHDAASDAWNRALAVDPADPEARVMRAAFDLCYTRGLFEESHAEMRAVIERDPLSAIAHAQYSVALSFADKFEEAIDVGVRARALDPNSFFAVWAHMNALSYGGDPLEAIELIPPLLPRYGRHPWLMMGLTAAYDRAGKLDQAEAVFLELLARSKNEYVQPAVIASTAEHAGHRMEALRFLRRAVEIRDPVLGAFVIHSPPMAKLRQERGFPDAIHGLGWDPSIFVGR
jgi:serine/threonine-protein kinase